MIKVLFICHGNICRSTIAEYVMKHLVKSCGMEDGFFIDSAATRPEKIGNRVHTGTRKTLREVGIPWRDTSARRMTKRDIESIN